MAAGIEADVAIVGSGIVGTLTALALQDAGFTVLVIEQNAPGAGTASGSAGYIHDGEIFPVAEPHLLLELPRMLLDPKGPLVFRLAYLPQLTDWGIRFLGSMRRSTIERGIDALANLNRHAIESLFSAAAAANAEEFLIHRGGLTIARDPRTLDDFAYTLASLENAGIPARALDSEELQKLEPEIASDVAGAIFFSNSAHCTDPERFGERLAAQFSSKGKIIRGRASALTPQQDGTWSVDVQADGSRTSVNVGRVTLTAGYWSGNLLRPLGYRVPLASARGYHLMIADPGVNMIHPMIFHEPHFAATPMNEGFRLAGTMEFASPNAPPAFGRAAILYELAKRYIPGLKNSRATTWMGIRPATPDSLPAIGRARHPNLYYCFGHGHLGLTQAAISARCVAALMSGDKPAIDLAPFDLARFG